jgi:hypothetical protein
MLRLGRQQRRGAVAAVPDDPYDADWSDPARDDHAPSEQDHGYVADLGADQLGTDPPDATHDDDSFAWDGTSGDQIDDADHDFRHPDDIVAPGDSGSTGLFTWDDPSAAGGHDDVVVDDGPEPEPGTVSTPAGADWSQLVGYGGTDPAAQGHELFDALGPEFGSPEQLPAEVSIDDIDRREWLAEHNFTDATWTRPDLLRADERVAASEGSVGHTPGVTGLDALTGLWQRLKPDVELPRTATGTPDVEAALAALESASGAAAIADVIAAVRELP